MSWGIGTERSRDVVDVAPLRAFQRAGNAVYDAVDAADKLLTQLRQAAADPWSYPPAQSAALLCTWNAYVLQTIGESLLSGAVPASGGTATLPVAAYEQSWRVFAQVQPWLACAQRAMVDATYRLEGTPLPADLPPWVDAPAPPGYLRSLLAASDAVSARAEVASAAVLTDAAQAAHPTDVGRLRGLIAQAGSIADYTRNLVDPRSAASLQPEVQNRLHLSLRIWFQVGQLCAMPSLLAGYDEPAAPYPTVEPPTPPPTVGQQILKVASTMADAWLASEVRASTPARLGAYAMLPDSLSAPMVTTDVPSDYVSAAWDPWCLTEPTRKITMAADPQSVAQLQDFWRRDPEPAKTATIAQQLSVAVKTGDIRVAVGADGNGLSLSTCPWPAVYDVLSPTVLGGTLLRAGRQVTLRLGLQPDGFFHRDVVEAAPSG